MLCVPPSDVVTAWRDPEPGALRPAMAFDAWIQGERVASVAGQPRWDRLAWRIEAIEVDPALSGLGLPELLVSRLYERLQALMPGATLAAQITPWRVQELRRALPGALLGREPELPPETARALIQEAQGLEPVSSDEMLLALCSVAAARLARRRPGGGAEGWSSRAFFLKTMGFQLQRASRDAQRRGTGCGVRLEFELAQPPQRRAPPRGAEEPTWTLLPPW